MQGVKGIAQRSPEWYAVRKTLITASEAGVLLRKTAPIVESYCRSLGLPLSRVADNRPVSAFKSRTGLYREKLGLTTASPRTTSPHMEWGTRYEPMAKRFYERLNKVKVEDTGLLRHPQLDWIAASPDGYVPASDTDPARLLEIKCPYVRRLDSLAVPLQYWIQMQIQMEVCGVDACDFFEARMREYVNAESMVEDFVAQEWQKGAYLLLNETRRREWKKVTWLEADGKDFREDGAVPAPTQQESALDVDPTAHIHAVLNSRGAFVHSVDSITDPTALPIPPTVILPPPDLSTPTALREWARTLLRQPYPPSPTSAVVTGIPPDPRTIRLSDSNPPAQPLTFASFYRAKYFRLEAHDTKRVERDREWFALVRAGLEESAGELRRRLKDVESGGDAMVGMGVDDGEDGDGGSLGEEGEVSEEVVAAVKARLAVARKAALKVKTAEKKESKKSARTTLDDADDAATTSNPKRTRTRKFKSLDDTASDVMPVQDAELQPRQRRARKKPAESLDSGAAIPHATTADPTTPKKPRGRPRKSTGNSDSDVVQGLGNTATKAAPSRTKPVKRRAGRTPVDEGEALEAAMAFIGGKLGKEVVAKGG